MNLQGDVIALLDENYDVVVKYTYDTWGKVLSVTDANGTLITDTSHIGHRNPIRYRGYYYDIETGLYYLQSRYYDPEVGRFISADEYISTGQGINGNNMFAYCFNNPVNRVDYTGKWWVTAIVATVVIIGCAFGLTGCAPDVQDAPNLDIENTPDHLYNCYGNAINKATIRSPSGYRPGDDAESTFAKVINDVGEDNIRRLLSVNDTIYNGEYMVALRCGPADYHFIRKTEKDWYNKSGTFGGVYATEEYVTGEKWYAQGINPVTGEFVVDKTRYYENEIIYFAIKIGWDKND